MYNNIDNMNVLFNIQYFNNSSVQNDLLLNKGKVFYGQEPPSGESTTTECGFNDQLLAVI